MIRYASVCSGIEAASAAWHPLGWQCQFVSEIEPFPCSVLKHHYPTVPNVGDMTKHHEWPTTKLDLLVGGTPCQAFSVAGLRQGLADPRGNLTLTFLGVIAQYLPRWVVWENVPGVLSDKTGAFGAFLGGLGQLGYGFAYRVLDAQYYGVAQRRRRVFVVAHLGGQWQRAAAVLFERESLCGDPPPRRESGQGFTYELAPSLGASGRGVERAGETRGQDPVVAVSEVADTLRSGPPSGGKSHGKLNGNAEHVSDGSPSLTCNHEAPIGFIPRAMNLRGRDGGAMPEMDDVASLRAASGGSSRSYVAAMAVRRLTPRECERLQGFPDDYTLVPHRGKPAADGPRYKALGNSMAVPVMRWLGQRIDFVDSI